MTLAQCSDPLDSEARDSHGVASDREPKTTRNQVSMQRLELALEMIMHRPHTCDEMRITPQIERQTKRIKSAALFLGEGTTLAFARLLGSQNDRFRRLDHASSHSPSITVASHDDPPAISTLGTLLTARCIEKGTKTSLRSSISAVS